LFRYCLGLEFTIEAFDEYGHVEIRADEDSAVRKEFGRWHTIWSEPEFVEHVTGSKVKPEGGKRIEIRSERPDVFRELCPGRRALVLLCADGDGIAKDPCVDGCFAV
jgi:hypothetical protein